MSLNHKLTKVLLVLPGTQVVSVCNRNLTSPEGHILSPGYPEYYPGPADCSWRISTERKYSQMEFIDNAKINYLLSVFLQRGKIL